MAAAKKEPQRADVLLHPIRLRLVQAVAAAGEATTAELQEALRDVPPATLYRHLKKLLDADLLEVTGRRKVRGATERTYALRQDRARLGQADLEGATADDHERWFMTFAMGLVDKLRRVLGQGRLDFEREGIGYHTHQLWLSDAELQEMVGKLNQVLLPYFEQKQAPGRRLRSFSTVLMPEPDGPGVAGD